MQIHVHTDAHCEGGAERHAHVGDMLDQVLGRFAGQLSRIDAHLSRDNAKPREADASLRCRLEARLDGCAPLQVSHHAALTAQAVRGAADKLVRLLESSLGSAPQGAR